MAQQTSRLPERWALIKYWAPVFLYCGIIIYLSSLSDPTRDLHSFLPELPELPELNDKLAHGIEYGILGILIYRALYNTTRTLGNIGCAILCTVAFGISDELHQWFVPYRHADIWDLLADTVGAICFILAWDFMTKRYFFRRTLQDESVH